MSEAQASWRCWSVSLRRSTTPDVTERYRRCIGQGRFYVNAPTKFNTDSSRSMPRRSSIATRNRRPMDIPRLTCGADNAVKSTQRTTSSKAFLLARPDPASGCNSKQVQRIANAGEGLAYQPVPHV